MIWFDDDTSFIHDTTDTTGTGVDDDVEGFSIPDDNNGGSSVANDVVDDNVADDLRRVLFASKFDIDREKLRFPLFD
jgi:hypothetical protein